MWTMDHLESKYVSIRQHTGAIMFTNGNLVMVYPTKTKNDDDSTDALRRSSENMGIPAKLKSDMAAAFVGQHTDFQKLIRKLGINMTFAEPYRHNQIQSVDVAIRDLKWHWQSKMLKRNIPRRLWCFGLEHQARLMNFIPRGRNERSGYEIVTDQTPDISEYLDFDFYDLVWYWRSAHPSLSEHDRELARWMGVAHRVGSDMCYWLMPVSGVPVVNMTAQHVTAEDLRNPDIKARVDDFDMRLDRWMDDTNFVLPGNDIDYYYPTDQYAIDYENGDPQNGDLDEGQPEADFVDDYNALVGATFLLDPVKSPGNVTTKATVIRRKMDAQGKPLGKAHPNPLLDTREYVVELQDGTYDSYFANTIAENLYTQCDTKGREFNVVRDILDHKTDSHALTQQDGYYMNNGQRRPKKTTAGWKLQVEFSDGSTDWISLKDLKKSNPIQLAEYAIANQFVEEPAFKWWVPFVYADETG